MKTPHRLTIAALGLAIFSLSAFMAQAQFNYETNSGTITITGYTGFGGAVTIPETINGLPVTSIGYIAFWGCTSLTSVTIPNSVTSIGHEAFSGCTSLTSVTILNGSVSIGSLAFSGCDKLDYARIGSGAMLFRSGPCPAGAVTIQATIDGLPVTHLGDGMFSGCTSLTSITIPDSVTGIGEGAFASCTNLTSIVIPNGVTSIREWAFGDCTGLTSIVIPNSVTSIGGEAFHGCTSLTSVTIPNSITSIGGYVFFRCTSLTSITIPNSVTRIHCGAFAACSDLTQVYFHGNAPNLTIPCPHPNAFWNCVNATVYYLPGTTGWGGAYDGLPTALWVLPYPVILTTAPNFGLQTNGFGFRVSWATNVPVVIESATTLANPVWSPVSTNALTEGWSDFSDAEWRNQPARFYRVRSQ